jgi:hypothetical protein
LGQFGQRQFRTLAVSGLTSATLPTARWASNGSPLPISRTACQREARREEQATPDRDPDEAGYQQRDPEPRRGSRRQVIGEAQGHYPEEQVEEGE